MNNVLPPAFTSAIFNTSAFSSSQYLTKRQADLLYAPYTIYNLLNATPGIATASKALIFDSSISITNINNLSANTLNAIGTTQSTSYTTGCVILGGGLGVAKDVYTNGSITNNGVINSQVMDSSTGSVAVTLNVNHLLSSGSPTNNSFGSALQFNSPNASNATIGYGKIESLVQLNTSSVEQGQLNFYCKIGGSFVKALELASLTSSTNNILRLNGATSVFSGYQHDGTIATLSNNLTITNSTLPYITLQSSATSGRSTINFITDNQTWEIGARGSTATNPTNFYIYNGGYRMLITPAGITSILNTTAATSTTTGAFICSGGIGVAGNSYFGGRNFITTTAGGLMIGTSTDNTRLISALNNTISTGSSVYFTMGYDNSSKNQAELIFNYKSSGSGTNQFQIGFFGVTPPFTMDANAQFRFNNPPTMSNGTGLLEIQTFGYHLNLIYNTQYYTRISSDGTGSFIIETNNNSGLGGYYSHYFQNGSLGLGNFYPRSRLDFGNTASDCIITLFQSSNLTGTYMFGANNSCIEYTSAGAAGHKFYYNGASGVGAPQQLGTNLFNIQANGNIVALKNYFANAGVHAFGFDTTDLSGYGDGVHMHYAGGQGSVFAYNYNAGSYRDLSLGNNNIFIKSSNGFTGINNTSPSCPLHVSGTGNQTTGSGFGWLSGAGTGTATGFTNRPFSVRTSGGIMCDSGEIDVLSDMRLKTNVKNIDSDLCNKFIDNINPISFNYKCDLNHLMYGFSAQELMKFGFTQLVGFCNDENEDLVEQIVECSDGTKIKLEKNNRLVVNLISMIPILVNLVKQEKNKRMDIELTLNKLIDSLSPGIRKKFDASL